MAYRILLTHSAEKELQSFSGRYKAAIINRLMQLRDEPQLGKPLKGDLADMRTIQEAFYRIVYAIADREVIVYALRIEQLKLTIID